MMLFSQMYAKLQIPTVRVSGFVRTQILLLKTFHTHEACLSKKFCILIFRAYNTTIEVSNCSRVFHLQYEVDHLSNEQSQ